MQNINLLIHWLSLADILTQEISFSSVFLIRGGGDFCSLMSALRVSAEEHSVHGTVPYNIITI